ncbi:MAG: EamA family transporter [Vulcanisaeta sp. AZ3]|jgi:DME family drug/metabolite transporter
MINYVLGITLAFAASVSWAISPILYRVGASGSALDDLISNSAGAFILALPFIFLRPPLNVYAWVYGILFAILGPVLGTYVFLISLRYADVGVANAVSYSYIVILPLLMLIFNSSYVIYLLPAAVITLGLYLLMGSGGGRVYGYAMALLSAVLYAFSFLALYQAYDYTNPWGIVFVRGVILMVGSLLLKIVLEGVRIRLSSKVFLAGLISYGIGGPLYVLSVYYAGIIIPTLITSLSPLITEALAIIRLGERLNFRMAVGFTMVVIGIIAASIMNV